jgi:hypothetical protein
MNLNPQKILEFSQILRLVFLAELSLETVDAVEILSENDEIVHPHCKNNSRFLVDIDAWIRLELFEAD